MSETNNKIWELNIYRSLKDISDLEAQKLSWLGKHPTEVSSFTEAIGMLYDSFAFEDYLDFYKSNHGVNSLYNSMVEFDKMINDYQETGYKLEMEKGGIEKILSDPQWIEISNKALNIIQDWSI